MRLAENLEKIVKNLNLDIDINIQTDQEILGELLETQKKSMKQHSAYSLQKISRFIMKSPMTKFAAAVVIIAVLIGINPFGNSKTNVLWADVAKRFGSVPFFHLTMYIGDDTSTETKKIEIWKSQDSRVRAQEGNIVVFADFSKEESKIVIFDCSTKEPVDSNGKMPMFLTLLCREGEFSLDTTHRQVPFRGQWYHPS